MGLASPSAYKLNLKVTTNVISGAPGMSALGFYVNFSLLICRFPPCCVVYCCCTFTCCACQYCCARRSTAGSSHIGLWVGGRLSCALASPAAKSNCDRGDWTVRTPTKTTPTHCQLLPRVSIVSLRVGDQRLIASALSCNTSYILAHVISNTKTPKL